MRIGPHILANNLFAAPMAGVTDRPFRQLVKRMGAGYAVSEMVASNVALYASGKSQRRMNHEGEAAPVAVQIAGAESAMMAEAAEVNIARGAQIIDINMGCPAKKVCNKWAGSALLQHEDLVKSILDAVVEAATGRHQIPVTLKFRTGWDPEHRNALTIAKLAEDAGVQMLTLHGRTRACGYKGEAEYDTIAAVKASVSIPVVANGDVDSPQKARAVLKHTQADAVMIGRAAQGRPWIFREIAHFLASGDVLAPPRTREIHAVLMEHLQDHYAFYGEHLGVRTARKHIIWYTRGLPEAQSFRQRMNLEDSTAAQLRVVDVYFRNLSEAHEYLIYQQEDQAATGSALIESHEEELAA
jgi:tRNA-dihydrouridine synthase B